MNQTVPAVSGGEGGGGRPPVFAFSQKMMQASVSEMAAVLDVEPAALSAQLTAAGYSVSSPDQSLDEIADTAGKSFMDMAGALLAQPH